MVIEQPALERYAVVLSHDCEFNDTKRTHFVIARLQDFGRNLDESAQQVIAASNRALSPPDDEPEALERFEYIDTFVMQPLIGCFDKLQLLAIPTMTALPMTAKSSVVELKKAELEHEHRVLLRRKLGFFFGREAEDDVPLDARFPAKWPIVHGGESAA